MTRGSRAAVLAEVHVALGLGQRGSILRLEANCDGLEVLPEVERDCVQSAQFPVQHFGAQRRAIEIHEREHDRLLPKIVADAHGLSGLIPKLEVRRNLRV